MNTKPKSTYVQFKAEKIYNIFREPSRKYKTSHPLFSERQQMKMCATICCEQIILALDDVECDENNNVMENINQEEKFYNEVIKEIEKL